LSPIDDQMPKLQKAARKWQASGSKSARRSGILWGEFKLDPNPFQPDMTCQTKRYLPKKATAYQMIVGSLMLLSGANAATFTIQPQSEAESKDTKIYTSVPTSNFSSNLNAVSDDVTAFQGLVAFDTSSLASILAAEIDSAHVRLYVTGLNTTAQTSATSAVVTLSPILDDWRETTASSGVAPLATWSALYGATPTIGVGGALVSQTINGVGFYDFDITSLAKTWVSGGAANYGVLIKAPGPQGDVGIADVDAAGAGFGPALIVKTVPEPSTLYGVSVLAVLAARRRQISTGHLGR
jgi:hypothetical protein